MPSIKSDKRPQAAGDKAHAAALDTIRMVSASGAVEWDNVKPIRIQHHKALFDRRKHLPPKKSRDARCDEGSRWLIGYDPLGYDHS